jgi:hypothetical protein
MVKGLQRVDVQVVITTYRDTVWLSADQTFSSEAIFQPHQVENLIEALTQSVREAREYPRGEGI